ncbi:MAG: NADH-quinone oxidoreductase subunit [Actinomycetota bacterium]|nr:NADH-quinone oxidoreductase subunit [Actinomycetota bacterium]
MNGESEFGEDVLAVILAAALAGPGGESLSDAGGPPCVDVDPAAWRVVMCAVRDIGGRLDWLGAVDLDDRQPGGVEVIAEVLTGQASVVVRTKVAQDVSLPSVRDVFAAAAWHEREAAEFLGITFTGGDPRPLLLADPADAGIADPAESADAGPPSAPPLRRRTPLPTRLTTPWPGASPDSGRRSPRVPGVHPNWPVP